MLVDHSKETDSYILYRKNVTWRIDWQGSEEPILYKNGKLYFNGNDLPSPENFSNFKLIEEATTLCEKAIKTFMPKIKDGNLPNEIMKLKFLIDSYKSYVEEGKLQEMSALRFKIIEAVSGVYLLLKKNEFE